MKFAIIGAGMSGLVCATRLKAEGHEAIVFDKGRGPGGRMSSRRVETHDGTLSFDHGAQYFTVRDAAFQRQVAEWQAAGLVAPWPAAGEAAFVGVPTMAAPAKALAETLDLRLRMRVTGLARRAESWTLFTEGGDSAMGAGAFDGVVCAIPAEQAADLLAPHEATMAARARETVSDPCWTLMLGFEAAVPLEADTLRHCGVIGWAARNGAKPGRRGPEAWVVQASPEWSRAHLEDDKTTVAAALLTAFADAVPGNLPPTIHVAVHRWRYAKAGNAMVEAGCLWNGDLRLGACGDWLIGPRVESAFVSGWHLATTIGASG